MPLWGKTDTPEDEPLWSDLLRNMDTAGREIIFVDNTEATLEVNQARGFNAPGWWAYYTSEQSDGNLRYRGQELLVAISQTAGDAGDQDDDAVAADSAPTPITISGQPTNQSTSTPAGAILTVDTIGAADALRVEDTYVIGASDYTTDAAGTGATFTVVVDGSGAATITVDDAGSGFVENETITIADADLGGGGAADLTFDVAAQAAAAAIFSVTAAGQATLQYQWQRQTASGTTWSNISGETSVSLVLTGLTTALNGYKYRVRISSTGGALTVNSDVAILTVTAA